MSVLRLTGADSITINGRLITDLPHAEVAKLTYAADLVTVKTGKNGNAIFAKNETGNQATLELKLLRGGVDDKTLNQQIALYNTNSAAYVLLNGELTKVLGDGLGNLTSDTYILTGGVITKRIEAVVNVEGDVEQAIALYTMQFALAPRSII